MRPHPWLRRIAITLAALVVLVAVLFGVLSTTWFREQLRDVVVRRANAAIDGELRIGAITGSLLHDLTLHDVVVLQQGQETIRVASLSARFNAVQLALGHYVIDEITIERPFLRLVQGPAGWNLATLVKPTERQPNAKPLDVAVRKFAIVDGQARVEPLDQKPIELDALNLGGDLRYADNALAVALTRGQLHERRGNLQVSELLGRVSVGDAGVALSGLRVVSPGVALTGQATFPAAPGGVSDLDLQAQFSNLPLKILNPYAPQPLPEELVISGTFASRGRLDRLSSVWKLETTAGASEGAVEADVIHSPISGRGSIGITRLNLAPVTGRRDLASQVTARTTFEALLDTSQPLRSKVSFTLTGGPIAVLGYRAEAVAGRGTLERGTLRSTGRASAYGASATFKAVVEQLDRAGTPRAQATGTLTHLDLRRLPAALRAPVLVTDLSGKYEGAFDNGDWNATLVADESSVAGARVHAGALATAAGRVRGLTASLDGELSEVPGSLLRIPESKPTLLGGTIHASVAIPDLSAPMTPDRMSGSVVLALGPSTVQGTAITRADVSALLDAGRLDVRQFEVESPALSMTALGTVAFTGSEASESDLTYRIDAEDLSALSSFGVPSLRGAAHVEGRMTGPAGQLQSVGTFASQRIGYAEVADALAFNGTFDAKMPDLDVSKVVAAVTGEGTFITVKGQEIQRLTVSADYEKDAVNLQARIEQQARTVDVGGGFVLHPDHREVHLRQFSLGGFGEPWTLASGETTIEYRDDRVTIPELVLTRGSERLEGGGTIVFAGTAGGSDFDLTVSRLQVGDVYALLTGTSQVTGTADARVHLAGTVEAPVASATLTVVDGKVANAAFSRIAGDVSLKDRRATVDARIEEPSGNAVTLTGTAPIAADAGPLDLAVKGSNINLALAQAFTTQVEKVSGTGGIDLRVTGPLAGPVVVGSVTVANGGFLVPATGVTYQELTADVDFDGKRATVRQLSVLDSDKHVLRVTGGADILADNGVRGLDLSIESEAIHVLQGELGDIEVSADAHVRGTLAAPQVDGRVVVNRGRIEIDQLLRQLGASNSAPSEAAADPALQSALAAPASGTTPAAPLTAAPEEPTAVKPDEGMFANASLHVNLIMPDDVVVRGRNIKTGAGGSGLGNMNLTLGGTLELSKDPGAAPIMVGAIEVVRGFYEFQGRRFQVTRGSTLRFRGIQTVNPSLDVTGEREVSGITARVRVTGTVQRPTLELSSDPPLDEGDVLSLIVFNQPVNQLGESEQVTLLERAGDLAAGMLATTLSDSLGRALDVDLFEIRAPSSGQAGEVSLGNQFNERLFVAFRQQFGSSDGTQVSFEYRLTQALRLLTSLGQGGSRTGSTRTEAAGLDMVYVIRY